MPRLASCTLHGIKEAMEVYDSKIVRQAIRSTLDKAGTQAKKDIVKDISANYYIKPADIADTIEVKRTTAKQFVVELWTSRKRFSLYKYFHAYFSGNGITVEVERGKPWHYAGAFLQTARQGNNLGWRGVMHRTGKTGYRRPPPAGLNQKNLQEHISGAKYQGPSIYELTKGKKIMDDVQAKAEKNMKEMFWAEIDKRMIKQGKIAY